MINNIMNSIDYDFTNLKKNKNVRIGWFKYKK